MDTKDQLIIVLKEYDALRKEIEDRVNTPKLYFVPFLFVALAGVLGWKAEAPGDLILLFVFPLILTFLSFALNADYYVQRTARQVAKIEDKVFRLTGISLLTHETEILYLRQKFHVWKAVGVGALVVGFYLLIETWLVYELSAVRINQLVSFPARGLLLLLLLMLPLSMYVVAGVRLILLHKANLLFRSKLMDALISNNFDYLISSPDVGVSK